MTFATFARSLATLAIACAMVVGCDSPAPVTDTGTGGTDTGTGGTDTGTGGTDTGTGETDTGTGETDAPAGDLGDFTLSVMGYGPHVTNDYEVVVLDGDTEVGRTDGTLGTPAQDIEIAGIIEDGTEYTVRWYMDLSDNGSCDAPPADHVWERTGTGTATGLTITHMHDTDWVDVCDTF